MKFLKDLWDDENGAVATEYIVIVGLIAVALIGSLVAFRGAIGEQLGKIMDFITGNEGGGTTDITPIDET